MPAANVLAEMTVREAVIFQNSMGLMEEVN